MLIFFDKKSFSSNVDICRYGQKTIYSKFRFPRNVDIFGCMGKNRCFQSYLKITSFFRNVEIFLIIYKKSRFSRMLIFGDMGKKLFCQNDLKKTSIPWKVVNVGYMAKNKMLKFKHKKKFFLSGLKKSFSSNVDIFWHLVNKFFFLKSPK